MARLTGVEGWGGVRSGRIRRKDVQEHRTLNPVTPHQGARQREREVWKKYGGLYQNMLSGRVSTAPVTIYAWPENQ